MRRSLAFVLGLSGCYQPELSAHCRVICAADMPCPDQLACGSDGLCTDGTAECTTPATSCDHDANTCGPAGNGSCCASLVVPGGTFARGYDVANDGLHADTSFPATVSTFRLDKYAVTVGRFRAFVATGMGTLASPPASGAGAHAKIATSGWDSTWNAKLVANTAALVTAIKCDAHQTWTDAPGTSENRPINCVTWYEAMAFCAWDGGFLPTEAESMYAASGGAEQRAYAWSVPPSSLTLGCSVANYDQCGRETKDVGSESPAGDGRWGQADLGGGMWGWALDYNDALPNPCNDCANLTPASNRVIRGGSYDAPATVLRSAYRDKNGFTPSDRFPVIGIRCARPAF